MRIDLFDFTLPSESIALRPAVPRDSARLLALTGDMTTDRSVGDLPGLLRAGDCLVFNDTQVIPAQLEGRRGEARIGATLHKREGARAWRAFIRNAKRLGEGDRIDFGQDVIAVADARWDDGSFRLTFAGDDPVELLLERAGTMPLPPYIAGKRSTDAQDADDYQTMFARQPGAVAAPTAALHFTPALMDALAAAGIGRETLTLHVGAGTFLPVKAEDTDDHRMHAEWGWIDAATADRLNAVRASGGRLIAVGTTSLRLLESAADASGLIRAFEGDTEIFITPGYRFRAIDGLMTNFHLPKSTLFVLVSALMGRERMQAAYAHAIAAGYRFYSYGDASLLLPACPAPAAGPIALGMTMIFLALLAAAQQPPTLPPPPPPVDSGVTMMATPVAIMIAGLDRNGDRVVSRAEYDAGVTDSFARGDANRDGMIGLIELSAWSEGELGSAGALPGRFDFDRDGDDRISPAEFVAEYGQRFATHDKDADGRITRSELLTLNFPRFERDRKGRIIPPGRGRPPG